MTRSCEFHQRNSQYVSCYCHNLLCISCLCFVYYIYSSLQKPQFYRLLLKTDAYFIIICPGEPSQVKKIKQTCNFNYPFIVDEDLTLASAIGLRYYNFLSRVNILLIHNKIFYTIEFSFSFFIFLFFIIFFSFKKKECPIMKCGLASDIYNRELEKSIQ